MPYFCSAINCLNNSSSQECQRKKITFHNFPLKNEVLLKFWLIQMKRTDFIPNGTSWLCSDHFEEDCFYYQKPSGRRILQPDAVPTKFKFTESGKKSQIGTCTVPTVLRIFKKRRISECDESSVESDSFVIDPDPPAEELESTSFNQDETMPTAMSGVGTKFLTFGKSKLSEKCLVDASVQTKMDGISALLLENTGLQNEVADLKVQINRLTFCVESIIDDNLMKTLTGFSIDLFKAIISFFHLSGEMNVYANLSSLNQIFVFFIYLRTGISQLFLSLLFKISQAGMSRMLYQVSHFLYSKVRPIRIWPSREHINLKTSPIFFRSYPNCRVILESIEFQIQRPTNAKTQMLTFSTKKNTYTIKGLIGKTPFGAISFISDIWPGSISDRELFLKSGILDHLDKYDLVVADRSFDIKEDLEEKGCYFAAPKFLTDKILPTDEELELYPGTLHHRVHYDLASSKFNKFKFFEGQSQISSMTFDVVNEYFYVVAFLINFGSPLLHIKQHYS